MKRLELRCRFEAELLDQNASRPSVRVQRVGLAAGPVEREHQLRVKALTPGMLGDDALKLPGEVLLFQARDLGLGGRLELEVRQGPTAPQRQRLGYQLRRIERAIAIQRLAGLRNELIEPLDVQLVRVDQQHGQQRARLRSAQGHGGSGAAHLQRPQDREVHANPAYANGDRPERRWGAENASFAQAR